MKKEKEIINLLNSRNYEDRFLGAIIMGRMGEEMCRKICTKSCDSNNGFLYHYDYNFTYGHETGQIMFKTYHLFLGQGGVIYYPHLNTSGNPKILYDDREE